MRPSLAVEAVRQVADEARPTLTQSLVVAAVEKVPAPKNMKGKHGHAVKRQHGFFAGNARIAVLPSATSAGLGAFLKENVAAQSHLLTTGSPAIAAATPPSASI